MKRTTLILLLLISSTPLFNTFAQETVSRELFLTTLNSVAHLKFEDDQVAKLMEYNEGFTDKVFEILDSDREEKLKKEQLEALSYTREVDLHEFLSRHETKKYLKYMEDELKPLTKKNKLLKHISKT